MIVSQSALALARLIETTSNPEAIERFLCALGPAQLPATDADIMAELDALPVLPGEKLHPAHLTLCGTKGQLLALKQQLEREGVQLHE